MEQIHHWLTETDRLGFVPVPIRGRDGRTLYDHSGRYWELTPWMSGTAGSDDRPSQGRVIAGFAALAAFHQRLARHTVRGLSPGLNSRLREVDWLMKGGFAEFNRVLDLHPLDPINRVARDWVGEASMVASRVHDALSREAGLSVELQPCLRDVRPDHFLFTDDRVTGLVDFGAMGTDSVSTDLARLSSEWLGPDRTLRASGLDAYHAIRPLGPEEISLIDVFEQSAALLGAGRWVRWHFLEGRKFEEPSAVLRGLKKGLERLKLGTTDRGSWRLG